MAEKPDLNCIFRDNPKTPEGKYLVLRRDGTVPPWPWFVMGGADPMVPWALRFYCLLGFVMRHYSWGYVKSMWRFTRAMQKYRREHGTGDPGKGPHRRDDQETIAKMRQGWSA